MADPNEGGVNSEDLAAETINDLAGHFAVEETAPEQLELEEDWTPAPEYQSEEEIEAEEEVIEPEPVEPTSMDETFLRLAEVGIDFGIRKGDLPEELHGAYDRLADEAMIAVNVYQNKMNQMQMAQAEMQQFAQRLEQDPQKVLLTMAITKPEAFQEAMTAYEEMQQDDRYKNMVIRELQAEAKLSSAERQQQVWQQRQMSNKIQVVTNATHVAADKHGVDREVAERYVAMQIQANNGDIDPRQVDMVVASLRQKTAVAAAPAKVRKVQQAPTQSVQGQGTPPSRGAIVPKDEVSPGLTHSSRNPFLSLVKQASRRIGND